MKLKLVIISFAMASCCLLPSFGMSQTVKRDDAWVLNNSYGPPLWIAFNDLIGSPYVSRREIFVYLEAQYFTPENMKKIFTKLSAEYTQPDWLDITIYSDKVMLQRAIDTSTSGVAIDFADTPEGRAAAKKWAEKYYPLPTGYYRARYSRIGRQNYSLRYIEERYSYSPDPAKPDTVTVVLRDKPSGLPYTGNLDTDLVMAAEEGDASKVRSLLSGGAKVDSRDQSGETALMLAVLSARDLDTVKALLAAGADVNARNDDDNTALILAASNDKPEITRALLDKGANINQQNRHGYSALMMASVQDRRFESAKLLVERGANLELKDNNGRTSLIEAAEDCVVQLVRLLLEKGARVDERDNKGNTALLSAGGSNKAEIIEMLAKAGANINARNNDGETALMNARTMEVLKLLLARGADVKAVDQNGNTVLIRAVRTYWPDNAVKALIDSGVDLSAKNKDGDTALSIARNPYAPSNVVLDVLEAAEEKNAEARKPRTGVTKPPSELGPQLVVKRDPLAKCCEEVSSVAFSPDGKLIASKLLHSSLGGEKGIVLWESGTGKLKNSIPGPPEGVISIEFTPDGREVVSAYGDAWKVESARASEKSSVQDNKPKTNRIYCFAMSPDGRLTAQASREIGERNKLIIKSALTGEIIRSWEIETLPVTLRFGGDSKSLAVVMREAKTIAIWNVETGDIVQKIKLNGDVFDEMAYSHNARMIAVGAGEFLNRSSIELFDASTTKRILSLPGHAESVFALAFSPDDKILASGSSDSSVKVWDVATGSLLYELNGHTRPVRSVAFSPDGRFLASGGGQNETKIWSMNTGKLLVTLKAFNDGNWIAYTPDGFYDRSEGADKYITWRLDGRTYDSSEFKSVFFNPVTVASRLR